MRNWTRWGAALTASAALAAVCGGAQAQTVAGDWHGALSLPNGSTMPIGITLKAKTGGGYEGSYTGPKNVIPLVDAKLDKGTLSFSNGSGRFSGRWDETRKAWVGQWAFQVQWIAGPSNAPAPSLSSPLVLTAGKP